MYKVISFGHRCSSASFIQLLNLKTESYPFDWLVSKLDVIKDCIETKFIHFLDVNNYITTNTETYNMIDNVKYNICNETVCVNMYYENNENEKSTYLYKLTLTHGDIKDQYEYYERCINRLYELFETDIQKYYIYLHPLIGINDYENNKNIILEDFNNFNNYIIEKTKNIFGIYFILIRHNENIKSIKIEETENHVVFILYCNENFLDAGGTFIGDYNVEQEEVLSILKKIFI